MRRTFYLLIVGISIAKICSAQLRIQSNIPPTGVIQRSQIWNLLVINDSRSTYDCRVNVIVRDRYSGQEVFTAVTGAFSVGTGAKQLNEALLAPIQYNYLLTTQDAASYGLLPAGAYNICYSISLVKSGDMLLPDECLSFDVEPLSPPMLAFPSDSTFLTSSQEQFSWTAPAPSSMFGKLTYTIIFAEVHDGQLADEAIQQNIPYYSEGRLSGTTMPYPQTARQFEAGKWYAWQVVASAPNGYVGKTETWVFKLNNSAKSIDTSKIYLLMEPEGKGIYPVSQPVLFVKYNSQINSYLGEFKLYDVAANLVRSWRRRVMPGENYFDFQLGGIFRPNTLYTIELIDSNKKSYSLTFKFITQ